MDEKRVGGLRLLGSDGAVQELKIPGWRDAEAGADGLVLPTRPAQPLPLEREQIGDGGHVTILRRGSDIGTLSGMTSTRPAIGGTAITAIALGAVGLLTVIALIPALKVLGLLLGLAAAIVGGLAAVNARRAGGSIVAPAVGAGLGVLALVWAAVFFATW